MLRVVVTGGEGDLSRTVVERLRRGGYDAIGCSSDELDVLHRPRVRRAIRGLEPDVVVDCSLPGADRAALVRSAGNVAAAAHGMGAYSIYRSTADVFDGDADAPYVESDVPLPATPLGEARLAAEGAVARNNPRHAILRASWLFGYGEGDPVDAILTAAEQADRVPADATTQVSPIDTAHLADAAAELVHRHGYGVFHVPGGGSCTELQFARALLRMIGSRAQAVPAEPGAGPPPPRTLVLATVRGMTVLPDWRMALQVHLRARHGDTEEREGIHS